MLEIRAKQALAVILAILTIRPFPVEASPAAAVIGSISSYGTVTVGDVAAPRESTLFAGDIVRTLSGNAAVQYKQGTRVVLADNSSAVFSASAVELRDGQMVFHAADQRLAFSADSLRLQPGANSSVNVTLRDGKATVAVTEGDLEVIDPSGANLASVRTGETKLFAMATAPAAPASAAAPAPSPAAPAAASNGHAPRWILLAAGAAVAATITTALVLRSDNTSTQDLANELSKLLAIPPAQRTAEQNARIQQLENELAARGVPVSPSH